MLPPPTVPPHVFNSWHQGGEEMAYLTLKNSFSYLGVFFGKVWKSLCAFEEVADFAKKSSIYIKLVVGYTKRRLPLWCVILIMICCHHHLSNKQSWRIFLAIILQTYYNSSERRALFCSNQFNNIADCVCRHFNTQLGSPYLHEVKPRVSLHHNNKTEQIFFSALPNQIYTWLITRYVLCIHTHFSIYEKVTAALLHFL